MNHPFTAPGFPARSGWTSFSATTFVGAGVAVTWLETINHLDAWLLAWMQQHATPTGIRVAAAISLLGSPVAMWILALSLGSVLVRGRRWVLLAGWIAAVGGGSLLELGFKALIHRPRPPNALAHLYHPSWSFPSGHALGSLIGFGMLAYVLLHLWIRRPRSRVCVVVGSGLLGGTWLFICIASVEVARRRQT